MAQETKVFMGRVSMSTMGPGSGIMKRRKKIGNQQALSARVPRCRSSSAGRIHKSEPSSNMMMSCERPRM
ncbi:MAG: hypothetical protein POELPBGB_04004 [Bacteroidia bacterium]|nr:hypothetical protein [Bacteroidia bacterium]